jgi:hypothetical protein
MTHNEMPEDTVEELVNSKARNLIAPGVGVRYLTTEDAIEIATTAYNKGVEVGRVEERDKARRFVEDYKEKYRGCGMADSMLALDELLEAITPLPDNKI